MPQVVARRVGRIMQAGPLPSVEDQQEFYRMGIEKMEAFGEAWWAMVLQGSLVQPPFALWWMQT